jgi:FlaA1/EpsC-like NDP-sugar epimerase
MPLMVFQKNPLLLVFPAAFVLLVLISYIQSRVNSTFTAGERDIVLVTGGAGFIGSHTIVQLLESGRRVICVDNFVNSSPKSLGRVRKIVGSPKAGNLLFVKADVTSAREMAAVFHAHGHVVSHVIHFCGLKAVFESISQPLEVRSSFFLFVSFCLLPRSTIGTT